jgi:hypothetical protein
MKIQISACVLGWFIAAVSAGTAQAAPSAQVFDAVKNPESVDTQWSKHLCAVLPQPCDVQQLGLYRPRSASSSDFVVLSAQPLAMASMQFSEVTKTWQRVQLHDFSSYAKSLQQDADGTLPQTRLSLAPALYPLAENKWAVAVLRTVSEMYSGGGASFDTADFVALDGATAVQVGIPFSCSKMVRACFSDKEYKTSKHCHDESTGTLRIGYGEAKGPDEPYDWKFTWHQTEWPHDQPQRAAKTTRRDFSAKTTESVDFCGGPQ